MGKLTTFAKYRWNHFFRMPDTSVDYINSRGEKLERSETYEEQNLIIRKYIESTSSFFLIRPGKAEYMSAYWMEHHKLLGSKKYKQTAAYALFNKNKTQYERFCNMFLDDLSNADIISTFSDDDFMEHYLVNQYSNAKSVVSLRALETFYMEDAWLKLLKDMRVLVISPFVDIMKKQYEKKEQIWGSNDILPDMNIEYLKSVWYFGDGKDEFESWFDADAYLLNEVKKYDFDIALIGCGPFSTSIGSEIKKMGKKAIQYGGCLQLLFGIRGNRWDDYDLYTGYYNNHWVRPNIEACFPEKNSEEIKEIYKRFDGNGCYF